jgi:hypothetical protein
VTLYGVCLPVALGCSVLAAVCLPQLVNSIAYLTRTAPADTFVPRSYDYVCHKGCQWFTDGILERGRSTVSWSWPGRVPLARLLPVRGPVWDWGLGHSAITSTVSAIGFTLISLFVIAFALLMVAGTVSLFRDRLPRRAA